MPVYFSAILRLLPILFLRWAEDGITLERVTMAKDEKKPPVERKRILEWLSRSRI